MDSNVGNMGTTASAPVGWFTGTATRRGIAAALALVAAGAVQPVDAQTTGPASPAADPEAGRLVDVDGRRLFLRCRGEGAPTVVFEAGYAADSSAWSAVEPAVAAFARTCVWDRGGTGQSAATTPARTSGDAVNDLHALLAAAGEEAPYVLVGHSYGGQNIRLFAAEFPAEVAGLVLVDALHEDYFDRLRAVEPAQAAALDAVLAAMPEGVDFTASSTELRAAGPLPDVPAVVVTRGTTTFPPEEPSAETEALWQELQRDLAARLPSATLVVAEGSGHNVPADRPEVVVAAIRQVVDAVRAGRAAAYSASSVSRIESTLLTPSAAMVTP